MRVVNPVNFISQLVIDSDLDFSGDYQVIDLASPATGEALRKGHKDIANAEVADAAAIALSKIVNTYLLPTVMTTRGDMSYRGSSYPLRLPKGTSGYALIMGANDPAWQALSIVNAQVNAAAAIAYSKLNLTGTLLMADLATAIKNAANGIAVLDASADVPDAQIPNLAASKITSGRFGVAQLPAVTDEKYLKGTGTNLEERPVAEIIHAALTVALFQTNSATGDMGSVAYLNDNNTANDAEADVNEYGEIDLPYTPYRITQYRHFGHAANNGDGALKLEYMDIDGNWQDWETGISTRNATWSDWASLAEVVATKIKLTCTTDDSSGGATLIGELEVKY